MTINGTFFASYDLKELTFGWTDYALFGGLLGVSVLIGIYFGCFSTKQDNTTEYLLGGKTMSFLPISMSLIASHISGVSLLGVPSEVYQYGTQYAACVFTSFITCFIIVWIYLPVFYKLQLTSTFEYLEIRFARPVRQLASFLYTLSLVVYVPLIIYVPALAFSQATGMNLHFVAPIICIVCIFYTTIGGLKAVVWADTVQMTVTVGSLVAVLILGTIAVGGVGETWRIAQEGGRIVFWNMDPSPFVRNSFWGMSVGLVTTWLASLGISQVSMQRFLAVPNIKEAQKSIWFLAVGLVVVKLISVFTGLTMYARYHKCDPIAAHVVARSDKILPYYVLDVAANVPGLPGLFLAGLVSAGLSTMSAGLNTVTGTIYEDFIDPWMPESNDKETKAANIMKVTVVILGLLCVGMVFLVDRLGDIFQLSLTVTGITAGTMLGLFSLGMLVPWATTKGAVIGGLVSMMMMMWIIVGAQWHMVNHRFSYPSLPTTTEGCLPTSTGLLNQTASTTIVPTVQDPVHIESAGEPFFIYRISFMYYTLLGALVVMVIGTVVSFICGAPDLGDIDRDHFPPFVTRFMPAKKYMEVSLHTVPTALVTNLEKEELKS
ncbi:PREDICTED: sodium-coupled monocarboxylate transporter 1-like [Dinoponera quadriceps]|uniref:Sodium-coupled monocarboxylate transporter 1-like n=1 Tax=Dinoponera quadriceps TaxID=609295 RepID=A0A6P3WPJ4_DINQU|nr:PREDICTED: sodium-coupled monocarboxylate transporter 1-like [Dinoponera quadriceps]